MSRADEASPDGGRSMSSSGEPTDALPVGVTSETTSTRAADLFREIERHGYKKTRVSGSHHIFSGLSANGARVSFPVSAHSGNLREDVVEQIYKRLAARGQYSADRLNRHRLASPSRSEHQRYLLGAEDGEDGRGRGGEDAVREPRTKLSSRPAWEPRPEEPLCTPETSEQELESLRAKRKQENDAAVLAHAEAVVAEVTCMLVLNSTEEEDTSPDVLDAALRKLDDILIWSTSSSWQLCAGDVAPRRTMDFSATSVDAIESIVFLRVFVLQRRALWGWSDGQYGALGHQHGATFGQQQQNQLVRAFGDIGAYWAACGKLGHSGWQEGGARRSRAEEMESKLRE